MDAVGKVLPAVSSDGRFGGVGMLGRQTGKGFLAKRCCKILHTEASRCDSILSTHCRRWKEQGVALGLRRVRSSSSPY